MGAGRVVLISVAFPLLLSFYCCLTVYPAWRLSTLILSCAPSQPRCHDHNDIPTYNVSSADIASSSSISEGSDSRSTGAALVSCVDWWVCVVVGSAVGLMPLVAWLTGNMLMRCEAARYFMRFSAQVFGFLLLSLWPCLAYEIVLAAAGEDHVNELAAGISILALVSVVFVIGLVNGRALVVRRFTIKSSKVRTTTTIAHISDLHIGSRSASWCSKVVDKVNSLHPDYVVITGDLVDTAKLRARDLKAIERISVPVLICLGNHDFWVKEGELENLLPGIADDESSNKPIILRDSILSDSGKDEEVQFLGIDDVERASEFNLRYDALAASSQFDSSKFTVLLHHRPHNAGVTHVAKTAKVDLFLSGHTHAGQMYPMNFLVMIAFRHVSGFFRKDSTSFYVSPGTGTWGPAVRLCSFNTVALFTITPDS